MSSSRCQDFLKPFALGGTLLLLSSIALSGAALGISVAAAAPLLVLFSPVLLPALLTGAAIFTGLMTFGGLGASAYWMYIYKRPLGAEQVDCLIWRVKKALVRTPRQNVEAAAKVVA